MKTIEINLYKFAELSDEAKEKAINDWLSTEPDYEWWDGVYEDANRVGIKITSFDTDRYCNGDIMDTEQTAHDILKEHGETCSTYKIAMDYLLERDKLIANWPKDELGEFDSEDDLDTELDRLGDEFEQSILEDYRLMLSNEFEYLTSRKNAIETIEANDYDFTVDGELY